MLPNNWNTTKKYLGYLENHYKNSQESFVEKFNIKVGLEVIIDLNLAYEYPFIPGCRMDNLAKDNKLIITGYYNNYGNVAVGKIEKINNYNIEVSLFFKEKYEVRRNNYCIPYLYIMGVAKETTIPFKEKELVLVKNNKEDQWMVATFKSYKEKIKFVSEDRYICNTPDGDKAFKYCISFFGNEKYLLTKNNPDELDCQNQNWIEIEEDGESS